MRHGSLWYLVAVSASCLVASTALGADAAALAKEGKSLLARGQLDAGCEKLDESVKLDAKSAVALDLAACREKQGKPDLAYRALDAAAAAAAREKATFVEKNARSKQKALEKTLALVTVTTATTVDVTVDGSPLDASTRLAPIPLQAGEHTVRATAAGKTPWERTLTLKAGQRETFEVPALVDVPTAVVATSTAPASSDSAEPKAAASDASDDPKGRLVVEVGFLGGLAHGGLGTSPTSTLNGLAYDIPKSGGGALVAACGDTTTIPGAGTCDGQFRAHNGGMLGGQLFVGWSLASRIHAGARAFGGTVSPGGIVVGGGPALSLRVAGPVWVGVAGIVGFEQQRAVLLSATGSVPPDAVANAGGSTVDVPLGANLGNKLLIDSGVVGGGTLEIAAAVVGVGRTGVVAAKAPTGALAGALLVGAWPSVMAGGRGTVFTVPAGFSYRFY